MPDWMLDDCDPRCDPRSVQGLSTNNIQYTSENAINTLVVTVPLEKSKETYSFVGEVQKARK